jgi:SAM-dependent methyltransferase
LEEIAALGKTFDFIDTSGVLHHLPNPAEGLKALKQVLRPEGVIFIMLYGQYGRTGVYMMQHLFNLLGLQQEEGDVQLAKEALSSLKSDHMLHSYLTMAPVTYDADLVDTFLHPQDRPYTVKDCLELVSESGLVFQGWHENYFYYPEGQVPGETAFYNRVQSLPEQEIWQAMELYHGKLSQHCFFVTHPDRDKATYEIHFEGYTFLDYVPVKRVTAIRAQNASETEAVTLRRGQFPDLRVEGPNLAVYQHIDGEKTIRECLEKAHTEGSPEEVIAFGRNFFRSLWHLGYVSFHLPQTDPT